ncbi:hypothetical protein DSO57_1011542 [Entomophthora muscae]|uniref:Uncharacterized protein n=1 Tax=Entomophthora muscae TaxID=34485 RepID=A0ACC2U4G9_9FUNG|nr:hypothetical protein DSO57_1011542 [Entomophthora muscae]
MENIVSNSTTTSANTSSPQPQSAVHSCWNPKHPNPFFPLEELLDFEDPIIVDSDPRNNIVTVELVPESPISKKQGDYTQAIDLEIKKTSTPTCKLDQSTCEHDDSMVMNYDSTSSYQQTRGDPAHQSDCKLGKTVYENSPMDIFYVNSPKEMIKKLIIDNDYLNTPMNIYMLESLEIFINAPMDEFNTPMECHIAIDDITKTKTECINVSDDVNTYAVPGIKVNNLESQQLKKNYWIFKEYPWINCLNKKR